MVSFTPSLAGVFCLQNVIFLNSLSPDTVKYEQTHFFVNFSDLSHPKPFLRFHRHSYPEMDTQHALNLKKRLYI